MTGPSWSVIASDGCTDVAFAGAPVFPTARLTRYVVPAVTSRNQTSLRPPVAAGPPPAPSRAAGAGPKPSGWLARTVEPVGTADAGAARTSAARIASADLRTVPTSVGATLTLGVSVGGAKCHIGAPVRMPLTAS